MNSTFSGLGSLCFTVVAAVDIMQRSASQFYSPVISTSGVLSGLSGYPGGVGRYSRRQPALEGRVGGVGPVVERAEIRSQSV